MYDVIKYCKDEKYGKFLEFVQFSYNSHHCGNIYNISTILNNVKYYKRFEQLFSAGLNVDDDFKYSINDLPKSLIKIARDNNIKLDNDFVDEYLVNPNAYYLAYNLDYCELNMSDITNILNTYKSVRVNDTNELWGYKHVKMHIFNTLIKKKEDGGYDYNAKSLLLYLDYLKTYEAINNMEYILKELHDYIVMMSEISNKFDKYPRNFLTTHRIASRNYTRLQEQFDEEKFIGVRDEGLERTIGNYRFIYPKTTQDIKDEAVEQNNCVASYIKKVITGNCHILFMRNINSLNKSLVTIEVVNNKIVQAKGKFNRDITDEEKFAVDKWNEFQLKSLKEKENKDIKENNKKEKKVC